MNSKPFTLRRGFTLPAFVLSAFVCALVLSNDARAESEFDTFLKPLLSERCVKCHRGKKPKGGVQLREVNSSAKLLGDAKLISRLVKVLDAGDMPPEDADPIEEADRVQAVALLKSMLRQATEGKEERRVQIRRLNRFQYNNAVRDLFRLDRDVFALPEKLMTRHTRYLDTKGDKMPNRVDVSSSALQKSGGLNGVVAFPKDLRALHGYDNQANQLALSPLLLEAFLKLSLSILDSPDFKPETVGIWGEFFQAPGELADVPTEVRKRLAPFLRRAFRTSVDQATLDRYASFVTRKVEEGVPFPDAMKKLASAVLSSPLFLYRYEPAGETIEPFALASNLSFFLWGSSPDDELLRLAESGDLVQSDVLRKTIDRMLADPKVERFLDTFPSQWMQLENILAATPDPKKHRYYSIDKNFPAGLQMVLEPLLLFDAVFIENRPIAELLQPDFGYQSDFLRTWYTAKLEPPKIDDAKVVEINKGRDAQRRERQASLDVVRRERDRFGEVESKLFAEATQAIDLAPGQAKWQREQARILAEGAVLSTWHRLGPFSGPNLDVVHKQSFFDEAKVDLAKAVGNRRWTEAKQLVDAQIHRFKDQNSAYYLYRTIQSGSARPLDLSIGSDDSFKLWLNGKVVADKLTARGVAPNQDHVRINLQAGESKLLFKVTNGGGEAGFYFKANLKTLPGPLVAAFSAKAGERTPEQEKVLRDHYRSIAPEFAPVRAEIAKRRDDVNRRVREAEEALRRVPANENLAQLRKNAQKRYDDEIRAKLRHRAFERGPANDPRYGGVITNAAMLSMTSGPTRTHPIARGAWLIEVVLNDPPPPPPNDVPPLNEDAGDQNLTIREKFAVHRENPDCAGCHSKLDPLGFALENFDITGRWRDKYENGRDVDATGRLLRKYDYRDVVAFKSSLLKERQRFARAFAAHLLRFALAKELRPGDSLTVDTIVERAEKEDFRLRSMIREVILSESFLRRR